MNENLNINSYKTPKEHLFGVITLFLLVATVFLIILAVKEVRAKDKNSMPTISVSGQGEVYAIPDISIITFSIREEAKTSKEATNKVAAKEASAFEFLASKGIDKKDIKTLWFNTLPRYEYRNTSISCTPTYCPPSSGKQELVGYESSETVQVKVRDIDKSGDIVSGLTSAGIGEVNGPEFSVDNPDVLKAEARRLAIEDAKEKAKILKNDLGVKLVRIISFNEGGDYPIYYGMGGDQMSRMETKATPAPEINFSTGEQKIISNVSIVYEIK